MKKIVGVADFETLTTIPTRIWAWDIYNIETKSHITGTLMEEFLEYSKNFDTIFFHNAKFDCTFIIDYLLKHDWTYNMQNINGKPTYDHTFACLRSTQNVFYSLKLWFDQKTSILFLDSMKLVNQSVKKIAETYNLPLCKLKIDYSENRAIDHELTQEEIEYIQHDTEIVGLVIKPFFDKGFTKSTIGSNALAYYQKSFKKGGFRKAFPLLRTQDSIDQEQKAIDSLPEAIKEKEQQKFNQKIQAIKDSGEPLDMDAYIRKAYRGGFTWVKKSIKGKDIGEGIVFDMNSMHPTQMYYKPMPYGKPTFFKGVSPCPDLCNIYHIKINKAHLKKDHVPCIADRKNIMLVDAEYLEHVHNLEYWCTDVDLALICDQYKIDFDIIDGVYFQCTMDLFKDYVSYWMQEKINATNKIDRNIPKLFLNNLYGKFGTRLDNHVMIPYLDNNIVKWRSVETLQMQEPIYVPIAVFITSYSRDCIIRAAQALYDRILYCDTDSLHLMGTDIPTNIDIDDKKLGFWKHETTFIKARFLRPKRYIELEADGTLNVKCGGMPDRTKAYVNFDNFYENTYFVPKGCVPENPEPDIKYVVCEEKDLENEVFGAKLLTKTVEGGIIFVETTYKMN